nr:inositol-3-phosphate synthase [Endozoicomonas sp.]
MRQKIKVAVAGIGNCASALIQGINFYRTNNSDNIPGIMFADIGGYRPANIEFVAAFDIDQRKVGLPLSQAIFAPPNCARIFQQEIQEQCTVQLGPILDGVAPHMESCHDTINFKPSRGEPVDVTRVLIDREVDILINYMPVGSEQATAYYAQTALDAGVAFLNCIPVFIASDPVWEQKFIEAGLPLIGDDMRSQFGASYFSQILQEGLFDRGHQVLFHCQTNVGGNTDFANMIDQSRLASKKISKENVIRAQNDLRDIPVPKDGIYAGPSSFIP